MIFKWAWCELSSSSWIHLKHSTSASYTDWGPIYMVSGTETTLGHVSRFEVDPTWLFITVPLLNSHMCKSSTFFVRVSLGHSITVGFAELIFTLWYEFLNLQAFRETLIYWENTRKVMSTQRLFTKYTCFMMKLVRHDPVTLGITRATLSVMCGTQLHTCMLISVPLSLDPLWFHFEIKTASAEPNPTWWKMVAVWSVFTKLR